MEINTPKPEVIAIEINNESSWTILTTLVPHFNELSFAENRGRLLVLNYEGVPWMIMTRSLASNTFLEAEIADMNVSLPLVLFTQK